MKLSLLAAACFFTSVTANIAQKRCVAFESPTYWHQPTYTVSVDSGNSSVLIYHVGQLKSDLQTPIALGTTVRVSSEPFHRCTPNEVEQKKCHEKELDQLINVLVLKRHGYNRPFINTYLAEGESATLEMNGAGVYCALVIQESNEDPSRIRFDETHFSRRNSLTDLSTLKVLLTALIVYVLYNESVFGSLFPIVDISFVKETFWKIFCVMLKLRLFMHVIPGYVSNAILYSDTPDFSWEITPQGIIEELYSILFMVCAYKVAIGITCTWTGKTSVDESGGNCLISTFLVISLTLGFSGYYSSRWIIFNFLWDFMLTTTWLLWLREPFVPHLFEPSGALSSFEMDFSKLFLTLSYTMVRGTALTVRHVRYPYVVYGALMHGEIIIIDYHLSYGRTIMIEGYLWNPLIDIVRDCISAIWYWIK